MSTTADAVIIGAGIVGAACADALSKDGIRAIVIEPGSVGGAATAAGMGHVVIMDDSEAQFALTSYSRRLWNQLDEDLPPEVEYQKCGTLWVAADDQEMAVVNQKHVFYRSRGVDTDVLDTRALAEAEPNLRQGLAGALHVLDDSAIYGPCAAQWLLQRAERRGCSTRLGASVAALTPDGVRLVDGSRISTGITICASGTWATELFPALPVRPRKGHLAITDSYPGFVRHELVELGYLKSAHVHSDESVAFNVQGRKNGQVLIGSSRQYGQTEAGVEDGILTQMLRRATEYMPALERLPVTRTWTGFRAATEDKLPIIGECPDRKHVYLATGHEGLGVTTSLGTGQLLADLVFGRTPAIDIGPYLPSRFPVEPRR